MQVNRSWVTPVARARRFVRGWAVVAAWLSIALVHAAGVPPPGDAATDNFYGTVVRDPYRYLEHTSDATVITWMRAPVVPVCSNKWRRSRALRPSGFSRSSGCRANDIGI